MTSDRQDQQPESISNAWLGWDADLPPAEEPAAEEPQPEQEASDE